MDHSNRLPHRVPIALDLKPKHARLERDAAFAAGNHVDGRCARRLWQGDRIPVFAFAISVLEPLNRMA